MVTVEDVLKAIHAADDPTYLPLQLALERFSLGTPIKGHEAPGAELAQVSFTADTKVRMEDGEVVLE